MASQAWREYVSRNSCTSPQARLRLLPMSSENADISCDTESTEERKFSDLETKVEQSEIRASGDSDVLPINECNHMVYVNEGSDVPIHARLRLTFCPKCGEKL
jgi:hypothetical protein